MRARFHRLRGLLKRVRNWWSIVLVFSVLIFAPLIHAKHNISSSRYELLSGSKRNSPDSKKFWDGQYNSEKYIYGKAPAKFLAQNYDFIPGQSNVLDVGMGEGRNAVFLARKGYLVTGVDISSVAIRKAGVLAREFGVRINTVTASIDDYKAHPESLDAIICFYYVDRSINKKLISWLKPGGILIYEANTDLQMNVRDNIQQSKKYLLRPEELLKMFPGLQILKYEEPLHKKDFTASIILRKPKKNKV